MATITGIEIDGVMYDYAPRLNCNKCVLHVQCFDGSCLGDSYVTVDDVCNIFGGNGYFVKRKPKGETK